MPRFGEPHVPGRAYREWVRGLDPMQSTTAPAPRPQLRVRDGGWVSASSLLALIASGVPIEVIRAQLTAISKGDQS